MTQPTVSIIVPTFNRAHYLPECLDSLVGQTVPPLEIIVVDDGSEDATREVVARYGAPVRYIYKDNEGKSTAVNLALSECRGDLIWLFDDDDVALPDAIEHRLGVLAKDPQAGFVYSAHYLGSGGPESEIVRGKVYAPPQPEPEAFFVEIMKSCFFHLNSALVRRECYTHIGGFDPSLLNGQDYDVQIRLARFARPVYSKYATFIFRQHQGMRGARSIRYQATGRNTMFRRFSGELGRKLRRDVLIGEYLIPHGTGKLTPSQCCLALINRMQVMANHGCIPEMFEDIHGLLETIEISSPIGTKEWGQVSLAICCGYGYDACNENWTDFLALTRRLRKHTNGPAAIRALARGFFRLAKSYPGDMSSRLKKIFQAARVASLSFM
ncbi:MAG: glycosyltransferase family 2 protein [Rhodocyclaceae bacterium]